MSHDSIGRAHEMIDSPYLWMPNTLVILTILWIAFKSSGRSL